MPVQASVAQPLPCWVLTFEFFKFRLSAGGLRGLVSTLCSALAVLSSVRLPRNPVFGSFSPGVVFRYETLVAASALCCWRAGRASAVPAERDGLLERTAEGQTFLTQKSLICGNLQEKPVGYSDVRRRVPSCWASSQHEASASVFLGPKNFPAASTRSALPCGVRPVCHLNVTGWSDLPALRFLSERRETSPSPLTCFTGVLI